MTYFNQSDIQGMERFYRANLINSISGIKPANLIGTQSEDGKSNLAIFSSVVHLGSNPALMGMVLRPTQKVQYNTYTNLLSTGVYTLNHVHREIIEKAHYTAAKFPPGVSEFEQVGLTPAFREGFMAPFVEGAPVQIGLRFLEEIPIQHNGTIFIIGEVVHLRVPGGSVGEQGHLDLEALQSVGIAGLDGYYGLTQLARFPYARPDELPNFDTNKTAR